MLFTPQNKIADDERKRKPNFSVDEVNVTVYMVEENNEILRCKFTNTVTNAKKEDVWRRISYYSHELYTVMWLFINCHSIFSKFKRTLKIQNLSHSNLSPKFSEHFTIDQLYRHYAH